MANAAKNAILKAKIEGVIYEIMAKTGAENVYVDETTTLATKLAEIVADCATKATKTELTDSLTTKANVSHTHAQSEVTGLEDALTARPTTDAMNAAISTAISQLIGGAPETYDTLKEIADYISAHQEVVDSLNAAIGSKADNAAFQAIKATVDALGTLASKDKIAYADLADDLKQKVDTASADSHSHANKDLLDTYTQTEADLADAVAKKHSHPNKDILDGITLGVATPAKSVTITLTSSGWDSMALTQTVTVSGVLADETKQLIQPVPAMASQTAYIEARILCTSQAADSLTFTAKTAPTEDLTVYVTIQEVVQG